MRPGQSCPGVVGIELPSSFDSMKSFNEAGAIMPRSGTGAPTCHGTPLPASMRPGQSCPGVGPAGGTLTLADVALQ